MQLLCTRGHSASVYQNGWFVYMGYTGLEEAQALVEAVRSSYGEMPDEDWVDYVLDLLAEASAATTEAIRVILYEAQA